MTTMITTEFGLTFEPMPVPDELRFRLPDGTPMLSKLVIRPDDPVTRQESLTSKVDRTRTIAISLSGEPLLTFKPIERQLRVSPYGVVNDDRAVTEAVLSVQADSTSRVIGIKEFWAAIYGLWLRRTEDDVIPVELPELDDIYNYLVHTGLAVPAIDSDESSAASVLLIRASFWQGAGTPTGLGWLRTPIPSIEHSPLAPSIFPFTQSFTRRPNVVTVHPLRPPKPAPGSVLYSRYICAVDQTLTFTHIDASNPRHFEAYSRWQNDERVNIGWRERGPEEKHRAYLRDRLADKHIMGFVVEWDGELAGYGEMSWVKEDPMATFVGGLGDYDQGTHLLIGEEKFRGRHRFTAIMVSMKHACFLRDPRTEIVVGEPRANLPIVPKLKVFLPQEFNREFELPHKRAVYFVLRRERFFQAATLY